MGNKIQLINKVLDLSSLSDLYEHIASGELIDNCYDDMTDTITVSEYPFSDSMDIVVEDYTTMLRDMRLDIGLDISNLQFIDGLLLINNDYIELYNKTYEDLCTELEVLIEVIDLMVLRIDEVLCLYKDLGLGGNYIDRLRVFRDGMSVLNIDYRNYLSHF